MARVAGVAELRDHVDDPIRFNGVRNAVRITEMGYDDGFVTRGHVPRRGPIERNIKDGTVVLGGEATTYTTRYYIKHPRDRRKICTRVMYDQCVPCHDKARQKSGCYTVWLILRSEAFLFLLHTASLVLGSVKEGMYMWSNYPNEFLIISCIETFLTTVVLVIRLLVAWERYVVLRNFAYTIEYVDPNTDRRLVWIRVWLRGIIGTGVFLIVVNIVLFLVFYFVVDKHLDWTVLTNQFLLITFLSMGSLFLEYRNKVLDRVREDQHKCALYESILLLNETFAPQTQQDINYNYNKVKLFTQALYETPMFDPPDRIKRDKKPTSISYASDDDFDVPIQSYV